MAETLKDKIFMEVPETIANFAKESFKLNIPELPNLNDYLIGELKNVVPQTT